MCHAFSIIYLEYESHDNLFLHGFLLTPGGGAIIVKQHCVYLGQGCAEKSLTVRVTFFFKKNELLNKLMTVHLGWSLITSSGT